MSKPIVIPQELEKELKEAFANAKQSRWFMRNDGVLFLSIDDLLEELRSIQESKTLDQKALEILIVGFEASRDIALMSIKNNPKK